MDKEANFEPMTAYRNIRVKYSRILLIYALGLLVVLAIGYFSNTDVAFLYALFLVGFIFTSLIYLFFYVINLLLIQMRNNSFSQNGSIFIL